MSDEERDKKDGKPESQTLEVDRERDAMVPQETEVTENQEDNTAEESGTGSPHTNDEDNSAEDTTTGSPHTNDEDNTAEDSTTGSLHTDDEDNTAEESTTGSFHTDDEYNTTEESTTGGPIKYVSEMKEGDQESYALVLEPEDGTVDIQGIILNEVKGTVDIQGIILNEVKIEENIIITNDYERSDQTLQLTNSGGKTGGVSILTNREALISKKLTKSDLTSANGLQLPGKEVRKKLLPHISAPALGEGKYLTLVDHQGQERDMLLVRQNKDLFFLKGPQWYDYAELYNLAVSDTIVIERISKLQVKEEVDFAAVTEIGDHDWDATFPFNSTWQIEQLNAEDVEQPDELAEQIEIKDIGKAELVGVMYEITIKRGPENTTTAPE
ncbi:hypothetical protein HAX54_004061 [Datura stramonium]|uniref:Uncharacterized protein n=1 Tax=Datura stramonium TaxID=4076 RepID=A0ABS8T6D8_DATST|nr:hypothetical protein [Datura stramonium]